MYKAEHTSTSVKVHESALLDAIYVSTNTNNKLELHAKFQRVIDLENKNTLFDYVEISLTRAQVEVLMSGITKVLEKIDVEELEEVYFDVEDSEFIS